MATHYQVTTTTSTEDDATALAQLCVERRLAACGQVSGPITSVYWWDGQLQRAQEWRCTLKTSAQALGPLKAALREAHGYTTPEIVATGIEDGDADYLAWIDAETSPRSPAGPGPSARAPGDP
ncbi:MAG: divalent-cation tolerance protein CutA [Acidimicrobiales bacterium]|jgi:periplasmic divalent cation tolerance protein